jgi:hypothetical protein
MRFAPSLELGRKSFLASSPSLSRYLDSHVEPSDANSGLRIPVRAGVEVIHKSITTRMVMSGDFRLPIHLRIRITRMVRLCT